MSTKDQEQKPDSPSQKKKKLSSEEIRQRRKKKAAARRQRILAGGATRLEYVQHRVSVDKLHEAEEKNFGNDTTSVSVGSTPSTPYIPNSTPHNPFISNSNMEDMFPAMGPNMGINDIMNSMFTAFGGNVPNGTSEQQLAKRKHEETVDRYNRYLHNLFCVLFSVVLVFLPYEYDVNIFGYSLSSDTLSFFVGFEVILFAWFYGYKQYIHRQYNDKETERNDVMNGMTSLMSMVATNIGSGVFGGRGEELKGMIQKFMKRVMILWSYIKMIRQLMSDLCIVFFLWIVLTAIKELIWK